MAGRDDDLAPKLTPPPKPDLGMRQGIVVEWNPVDGENVINVGGTDLVNLSMINLSDAPNIRVGDVVAIHRKGFTYYIGGRIVEAGSPDFGSAAVAFDHGTNSLTNFSVPLAETQRCTTNVAVPGWANRASYTVLVGMSLFKPSPQTATNVYLRAGGPAGGGAAFFTGLETGMSRQLFSFTSAVIDCSAYVAADLPLTFYAVTSASPAVVNAQGVNQMVLDVNVTFTRAR